MPNLHMSNNMTKVLLISGVALLGSSHALAEVTLSVDENIKVTAINGKSVNTSLFQPIKKSFKLTPGQHVITARYDRLYDLHGDNHDYLKSDNVTIKTQLQDNQTYRLTMPGQPERYQEARKYAKSPTLAIMNGNTVLAQETSTQSDNGLFSSIGSILGGGNSATQQNQQAIAAINVQNPPSHVINSQVATTTVSTPSIALQDSAAPTLDRFMQLWLQATPSEREKIRQWVQK